FYTRDLGHWWADVHWFQGAPNLPFLSANKMWHKLPLRLRSPRAFYTSYPHTTMFRMAHESVADYFDTDYSSSENLGPNWPQYYTGSGSGYHTTNSKGRAVWKDDTSPPYSGREVVN